MLLALTTGRSRPTERHVLRGRDSLNARLTELMSARSVTLWEAMRDDPEDRGEDEPEWSFTPKARIDAPGARGREAFLEAVGSAALQSARGLYMTGDCWSLAAVASEMLDRPIALFVADMHRERGEPDHVAVDLGDGLYLDVRGVLDAKGVAQGLNPGARPEPETVDVEGLKAVFTRQYGNEGHSLEESLACNGWESSTRAMVEMFLEDRARAAMTEQPAPRP